MTRLKTYDIRQVIEPYQHHIGPSRNVPDREPHTFGHAGLTGTGTLQPPLTQHINKNAKFRHGDHSYE
ncbi:hypothetical protein [Streptomyces sp. NPDC001820]|uniref:hypothetical protein n=1 Tax=Streptomyces sp. NPDC001820 TaxID=3364613 RepID=UPI0036B38674